MKKFNPFFYYVISKDESILDKNSNLVVFPRMEGSKLVIQYYNAKYQANITIPEVCVTTHDEGVEYSEKTYASIREFVSDKQDYLVKCRENKSINFRQAFFLGAGSHAVPMVYLREGSKECILYADTKSIEPWVAHQLCEKYKIKVFVTKGTRQQDWYSCYTEALIIGRDTTAIESKTGEYRIPDLLSKLESREEKEGDYSSTKLPDELLKTSQLSFFTDANKEQSHKIIHKNETLELFRKRYTQNTDVKIFIPSQEQEEQGINYEKKDISTYLRLKGIKYADIIEIQFYINQLSVTLGNSWTPDVRENFITEAKNILHAQELSNYGRPGLFDFAKNFVSYLEVDELISKSKNIDNKTDFLEYIKKQVGSLSEEQRKRWVLHLLTNKESNVLAKKDSLHGWSSYSIQTKSMHIALGILLAGIEDKNFCKIKDKKIIIVGHYKLDKHVDDFIKYKNDREYALSSPEVHEKKSLEKN